MSLERIDGLGIPKISTGQEVAGSPESAPGQGPAFGDLLRNAIREANQLQHSADAAIQGLSEDGSNVAEVMTAVEKADLAFRTLMQVRNKLVDAYEELMRLRM